MIALVIVACSLFLAFIDKPKLFQKPVNFRKIFILVVLIAVAVASYIKEHNNDVQQDHATKTIDSLNTYAKLLNVQIDTLRKENKVAQQEYVDSLASYHYNTTNLLARYGLKVDTLRNTISKFDTSLTREVPPTLTILGPPEFAVLNNNETTLDFRLTALNADVHILEYYYAYLNVHHFENDLSIYSKDLVIEKPRVALGASMNFTSVLPAGGEQGLTIFVDRLKKAGALKDTFFVAIHCDYKSKGNKVQTPLRKIYLVNTVNKTTREVTSIVFYHVSLILKKNKIWSKFYNL